MRNKTALVCSPHGPFSSVHHQTVLQFAARSRAPSDQEHTMEDKTLRCLQNKSPRFTLGSVGPYDIQVNSLNILMRDEQVSDEVMNSICDILSKDRPGVVHINCQALTKILDGSKRAKSHYFLKNNILERATEVFGVYLENGNHWSFFHCNVDRRCITYFNSLGETEWQCQAIAQHWSAFAASRGVKGEWDLKTTKHNLQTDSVSCGIHTLAVGKKDVPPNVLQQPRKAKTKVTIFSTLTEGEAEDLAKGFGMALTKLVPKDQLLSGIHEEDIPATL
ncbi:uncharacterized protein LOC113074321 isoform X5 [Carassius auratus]|nr:uncharacterized protein LOC113074321 isoform X5 [Carassius auratus]